jgi:ADP-dependent NAD(P)H-hydrate dehydratase / NAD(P)H-hydrate epimerase
MPTPVHATADIRRIEAAAFATRPVPALMERAGLAAAECARDMLGAGDRVLVLAGPGNNGGDAFVVARHLAQWWHAVDVVFTGDADHLPPDAAEALDALRACGITPIAQLPDPITHDLIVDGLFGIGLRRDLDGAYAALVARVAASGRPVLALDIPSGLDADTGRVLGCAIRATRTITFIATKPGLQTLDGPDHCGTIEIADLGLGAAASASPSGTLIDASDVASVLAPRHRNSHKGTHGDLWIVGGAAGMVGAAFLAARAGLLCGAGRVLAALLDAGTPLDLLHPELMIRPAFPDPDLGRARCIVVGPGLGQSAEAAARLDHCLGLDIPLLLDADALNLVAASDERARRVADRRQPTILTPHPAEAGRLLGVTTPDVQRDRVASTLALATRFHAAIVLKGAGSIVATPDGRWAVNTTGNPGMAVAGMGDVLCGIVGALVAQGAEPAAALRAGVRVHGLAGDDCATILGGFVGITASEVTLAARAALNRHLGGGWSGSTAPKPLKP